MKSDSKSHSRSNGSTGFDRFELHEALLRGIRAAGFETPRPIQFEAMPAALQGRDVLGLAQTGTGKTAAFALPILHRLLGKSGSDPRVLVLAPTRELASQITDEIRSLARFTRVQTATIYGGVSIHGQVKALRQRPEIVVGCPGRVLDLLQQGILRLNKVETLVLDEADHMFDMGFLRDIRKILKTLPTRRQNLLFSATMPNEIRGLADELLRDPHVVRLSDAIPASTIDHALYSVREEHKRDLLEAFLTQDDCNSAIVFTRTKHRAKRLADQLVKAGHRAVGLQGNMSQGARDRAMGGFRSRRFDILVATDIAARGIDVSGISHVINFDVPNTPEAYTHRIGRTGRAELEGVACTFVTAADRDWVRATERMIGSAIQRREIPGFTPRAQANSDPGRVERESAGSGRRGRPGSGGRSRGPAGAAQGAKRRNGASRSHGASPAVEAGPRSGAGGAIHAGEAVPAEKPRQWRRGASSRKRNRRRAA